MSPKHLQRYVDEFVGRHNFRGQDTEDQMDLFVRNMEGKRLEYKDLIKEPEIVQPIVLNVDPRKHDGKSRLSADDIREVRKLYEAGKGSHRKLAKMFNVSHGTIRNVLNRG